MKKLFNSKITEPAISFALLLFRATIGGLMIPHGYSKLMKFAEKASTFSNPFGIGAPASMALTIFAELFCAVLIVLGLMTRLACIPLIIVMATAAFYSHQGDIFGKGELATLYLAGFIALLFTGPGKISMDRWIGK